MEFHRRLPGYAVTPLVDLSEVAQRLGLARVLVKDETSRLGLPAFKILGASWAVYRLLVNRLGSVPRWSDIGELTAAFAPLLPLSLVTATDGNHGRAVARVAGMLGLGASVFVPRGTAAARITAIEGEGAVVQVVDGDYDLAVARAAEQAGPTALVVSDTSWDGYTDVPRWVAEGYSTIFAETELALAAPPATVVIPVGVGALAAAAIVHYRIAHQDAGTVLAGVEPRGADCVLQSVLAGQRVTVAGPHLSMMVGLNCGTPSLVAWPLMAAGLDWCVSIDDSRAVSAMRSLARAGVISGETGAAALAGLETLVAWADAEGARPELGLTDGATALVICTEGITDPVNYEAVIGLPPGPTATGALR